MTATDAQVRIALIERNLGRTQTQAAAKANLRSRETVAKYERMGRLPSDLKGVRQYRTREDAFAEDWETVEPMLEAAPTLEAKALFEWLCERRPGRYQSGQLRTFQRRVSAWRALNVAQLVILEQDRRPGELMQTDGTKFKQLEVTICGAPFDHVFIHSVLAYSNWEWGVVAQSESHLALLKGFQSAVRELGYVPRVHQTDNTTAATHDLKAVTEDAVTAESGRIYNQDYLALMEHYGVTPRTTHVNSPDENGDIEAVNGALARALEQWLLLRGSREFESIEAYEAFVQEVMQRRNRARSDRLAEELAAMRPLSVAALLETREYRPRVSRSGTVRLLGNTYSVPSSLIGRKLVARVGEWHIDLYFGTTHVQRMPRLTGKGRSRINYRHVVRTLLRKPGGFRGYRHREQLYPSATFRAAWEALDARLSPRRADLTYLRVLKLAADHLETDVEAALQQVLATSEPWDDTTIHELIRPAHTVPELAPLAPQPAAYDQLLEVICERA